MDILNEINWRTIRRELESSLTERFRRVWVQYTRFGTICLTVFPTNQNESYRIIIRKEFIDCNKNVFSYVKSFMPDFSYDKDSAADRVRAKELLTSEMIRLFTEEINK